MSRKLLIGGGVLVLVLAAAGGGAMLALRSPGPRPTVSSSPPRPTLAATTPSAAASVTPLVSPSPVSVLASLRCKIAVAEVRGSADGGWIQVPGGAYTRDPSSNVKAPEPAAFPMPGLTHVARLDRWLPAWRNLVAPDATHFVFVDDSRRAIAVATYDRVEYRLKSLPPTSRDAGPFLLAAEPEGVYLTPAGRGEGLYLVDWSDKLHTITDHGFWDAVGGGYAYGTVTDSVPAGAATVIRRRDLKSGAESDYFTRTGQLSRVVGFGAGQAPVFTTSGGDESAVWLGGTPPVKLASHNAEPKVIGDGWRGLSAVGDGDKTWFTTSDGLFLYTPEGGVEDVGSKGNGYLASVCRPD